MEAGTLTGLPVRTLSHGEDGARTRKADSHCNFCPCVASSLEEIYTVIEAGLDTECCPWQIRIELQ